MKRWASHSIDASSPVYVTWENGVIPADPFGVLVQQQNHDDPRQQDERSYGSDDGRPKPW
jgi:hypothetical protein